MILFQGPDLQESPRGSSVSSGPTMKRDDGSQPHMVPQGGFYFFLTNLRCFSGMPMQGHILIDPTTGQHYIIPQAAFYQPIPQMQPMFYPPPQPQPMFYPYAGQHMQGISFLFLFYFTSRLHYSTRRTASTNSISNADATESGPICQSDRKSWFPVATAIQTNIWTAGIFD